MTDDDYRQHVRSIEIDCGKTARRGPLLGASRVGDPDRLIIAGARPSRFDEIAAAVARRSKRRRAGAARVPAPHQTPMPRPSQDTSTFTAQLARVERERHGRLRSLWPPTAVQRVAAIRRGELTFEQLARCSARYRVQVPTLDGEFAWIRARTPEGCG